MRVKKFVRSIAKNVACRNEEDAAMLMVGKIAVLFLIGVIGAGWADISNMNLKWDMEKPEWRAAHPELVEKSLEFRLYEQQLPQAKAEAEAAHKAHYWSNFAYRLVNQDKSNMVVQTLVTQSEGKSPDQILQIVQTVGEEVRREMGKRGNDLAYSGTDLLYERPDLAVRLVLHDKTAEKEIDSMFQTYQWDEFFSQLRERKSDDTFVQSIIERLPGKDASLEEVKTAVYQIGRDAKKARAAGEKIDFRLTAFTDNPYYAAQLVANGVKFAEQNDARRIVGGHCAWGKTCLPTSYTGRSDVYYKTPAYESYYQTQKALNWFYAALVFLLALISPSLYRRGKRRFDRNRAERLQALESELAVALEIEAELEFDQPNPVRVALEPGALAAACEQGNLSPHTRKLALAYVEACDEDELLERRAS